MWRPGPLPGRGGNGILCGADGHHGLEHELPNQSGRNFWARRHNPSLDSEEEALALANATKYGLAATVWTENLKRAHRVAANIHSGIVLVNNWLVRDLRTPFGGVKASGVGREGGFEALRFFTEPKNVYIDLGE